MEELMKRRSALKKKLRSRARIFAAWTSLAHPSITEIFARTGVDFVGIDIEHSTISLEQSREIIAASQASGTLCLPRIASHNAEAARRLLDSGADGLIVPTVSSRAEAENIVAWSKYPPLGRRGFGVARAQGYGFDFDRYTRRWNAISVIIPQIESAAGVARIDEIASCDAIDAVMVGPYDISGSLGIPGQIGHRRVKEAARVVIDACRRHRKGCGTQIVEPDRDSVERAFREGYTFVVLSSDIFLLWRWSDRMRAIVAGR